MPFDISNLLCPIGLRRIASPKLRFSMIDHRVILYFSPKLAWMWADPPSSYPSVSVRPSSTGAESTSIIALP
ncbi:hypothetical protein M404DRAFT_995609 [Pisolithus tinctorius Marx 270]|uniref:Uncharacterized protein n=1 Tax=Pisolithus tinctorius Marx 270 TaxID=870435 RepID=A0A0C3KLE0_PISTI|nr:hypothetical protein M404DRAFT_995609 [Pisolithus tinctorius Marx 270]